MTHSHPHVHAHRHPAHPGHPGQHGHPGQPDTDAQAEILDLDADVLAEHIAAITACNAIPCLFAGAKIAPRGISKSPREITRALEHGTTCKDARDHSRNFVKLEESELSQRWPSTCRHLLLVASRTSVHNVAEHSALLSAGNTYY